MSKETRCPSARLRIPAASTAVACTNTSFAPPSGEMKPKPLLALKNLTVPIAMIGPSIVEIPHEPLLARCGDDHRFGKFGCLIQRAQGTVGCLQCASLTGRRRPLHVGLLGKNYNPVCCQGSNPARRACKKARKK